MSNVKEAVKAALGHFNELFPDAKEVRLEEVTLFSSYWDITVSYLAPPENAIQAVIGNTERIYKIVRVDGDTGELESIKIRKL